MATTLSAEIIDRTPAQESALSFTVCHFTTAHSQLKSRSFHRELLPLTSEGVRVRYLAPMPARPPCGGVDFIALPQHKTRFRRTLALRTQLQALLHQNACLYHFQDPELFPVAFVLKLLFQKRIVYDAYEDFPSMAANKSALPRVLRPLAAQMVATAERLAALCFDGVMTADAFTLRRLARHGRSKKLVFYNFPNLDFFPAPRAREKRFDVVYRGGLSERAGTFLLLDAMRILLTRAKACRLLLVGYFDDPAAENSLRGYIKALGLESNVEIRGRLDHESMSSTLGEARIGVSPLQPIPKFLLNIPVKIFEYWACGLPVVASDLPPMRPFFRDGEAGLLFMPGDAFDLAQSIERLLDDPDAAARMGTRGRDLVAKRFNNEGEVLKLREFFRSIAALG